MSDTPKDDLYFGLKPCDPGTAAKLDKAVEALHGKREATLGKKIAEALNSVSAENGSNTPDFLLATYLTGCLAVFNAAVIARDDWYGHRNRPGQRSSEAQHLRMQIGYLAGELQIAGDKRSTPEIVETAAKATATT